MDTLIHWRKAQQIWPELLTRPDPVVRVNNRLTRTAGLCYVETGQIFLSGPFLDKYFHLMMGEILAHETAHYVDFCLYGWQKYKRHHGRLWQGIMHQLGYNAEAYHSMRI